MSTPEGALNPQRVKALLAAYRTERPTRPIERGAWPVMLRAAALRFWLARLELQHQPVAGAVLHQAKDPTVFRQMLARHIEEESLLRALWR